MGKKREYNWYVEPLNSKANEVLGKHLPEESFSEFRLCADKVRRNLWSCTRAFAEYIWNSRDDLGGLKMRIFSSEGKAGQIRDVTFLFKRRLQAKKSRLLKAK